MAKFPIDAPIEQVITAFERLGFRMVRTGTHISMVRDNPDGTRTPLTLPNHRWLKSSTLRTTLTRAGISRDEFLNAYAQEGGCGRWLPPVRGRIDQQKASGSVVE